MQEKRGTGDAVRRGMIGLCPKCGTGKMFDGYLTVAEKCTSCGEPLGEYRAADGPAFFTISIVGILLIPILGLSFVAFRPDPIILLLAVVLSVTVLTLVLLRLVKGAFVAFLWANHERDAGA